jgi:hypothetical protein
MSKDGAGLTRQGDDAPVPTVSAPVIGFVHQLGATLGVLMLYGPGHQAVKPAMSTLYRRILDALASADPLVLANTPQGLLLDGVAPVPTHLLSVRVTDFFNRLGVAIFSVESGIQEGELEGAVSWLAGKTSRLAESDLAAMPGIARISIQLLDFGQVMAEENNETQTEKSVWENLVGDFLAGKKKNLSEREMTDLASLVDQETIFAGEIAKALGNPPPAEGIANLSEMMSAVRQFMDSRLAMDDPETMAKLKKCAMALPEHIRIPLLELPIDAPDRSQTVLDILNELAPEEVISFLTSSFNTPSGTFKRMVNVFQLLSMDGGGKQRILPQLKTSLSERERGRQLTHYQWKQVQKFMSPTSDRYISESYSNLLDMTMRFEDDEEDIAAVVDGGLKEECLESLKSERMAEDAFWVLISDLLVTERADLFESLRSELTRILGDAVESGDLKLAAGGIEFLASLAAERSSKNDSRGRQTLRGMLQGLLSQQRLEKLVGRMGELGERDRSWVGRIFLAAPREMASKVLTTFMAEQEDTGMRETAAGLLRAMGHFSRAEAVRLLDDPRWQVVRNVVAFMGETKDPTLVQPLVPLLKHREKRIRREVVGTLQQIGSPEALGALAGAVWTIDDDFLPSIISHLGGTGVRSQLLSSLAAMSSMSNRFGRRDGEMKRAIGMLGRLGGPEAIAALRQFISLKGRMLLGRRRQELAVAAVNALASMEGPEATDLLEWAAKRGGVVGKLSGGHLTRRREKGRS